jgi:hypothetical protein
MEKQLRENLIKMAWAVCEARGLTEETIALRALKDNTFFRRMRSGAGFTVRTYDRLMGWMEAQLQSEDAA